MAVMLSAETMFKEEAAGLHICWYEFDSAALKRLGRESVAPVWSGVREWAAAKRATKLESLTYPFMADIVSSEDRFKLI